MRQKANSAGYLAALEAGADGIDLAAAPLSGGTSQVDFLSMIAALKGSKFKLDLDEERIIKYEKTLAKSLDKYQKTSEAQHRSTLRPR